MVIIRSRQNAQRKRIPRFVRVGAAKKAHQVRHCDHGDVYVSVIERWGVERWTLDVFFGRKRRAPTPNIERRISLGPNRLLRSDVAAAPFKLLPDYTEE